MLRSDWVVRELGGMGLAMQSCKDQDRRAEVRSTSRAYRQGLPAGLAYDAMHLCLLQCRCRSWPCASRKGVSQGSPAQRPVPLICFKERKDVVPFPPYLIPQIGPPSQGQDSSQLKISSPPPTTGPVSHRRGSPSLAV
jgi:hypothetical protein